MLLALSAREVSVILFHYQRLGQMTDLRTAFTVQMNDLITLDK